MWRFQFSVFVIWAIAFANAAEPQQGATPVPKIVIVADELNGKYEVHGPLGIPLGDVVTIVGQPVQSRLKSAHRLFQVNAVNGRFLIDHARRAWVWLAPQSGADT
jgi:hypothetical protein